MTSRWNDVLRPSELLCELLAVLPGQQALHPRHVFVLLMLDVMVQQIEQSRQQRIELGIHGRHVLELVEIFFDLGFT